MNNFNVNASHGANRKKKSMVLVGILAIVLLITGTFAWRDYNQHKTNRMQGVKEKYGVSLNDSFNPNDHLNMQVGDTADKVVNVTNEGEGDVYIRLRIGEFIGYGNGRYQSTEHRYMVNEKGNFVTIENTSGQPTITDAELDALWDAYRDPDTGLEHQNQTIKSKEALALKDIDTIKDMFSGKEFWYIRTDHTSPNGIYGKHVPIGIDPQDMTSLIDGKVRPEESDIDENHHNAFDDFRLECEKSYVAHDFRASNKDADSQTIQDHFKIQKASLDGAGATQYKEIEDITSNTDVELMSNLSSQSDYDAIATAGNGKWILDDRTGGENWIYWSAPLTKKSTTNDNHKTTNLIDQIEYVSQVEVPGTTEAVEMFEYFVHIDMQALSKNELEMPDASGNPQRTWANMPQELFNAWTN